MSKFKQIYKLVGKNIVTKTTEPTKAAVPKVTDPSDPEFVIDNPHSPDFGKKRKDTVAYKTEQWRKENPIKAPVTSKAKTPMEVWTEKRNAILEAGHRRFKAEYPDEDYSTPRAEGDASQTILTADEALFIATPPQRDPVSKEQCYYIAAEKYYMLYEDGIAYVFVPDSKLFNGMPLILSKHSEGAIPPSSTTGNQITHTDKLNPVVNLSKEEFQNILNGKPSYNVLTTVYRLFNNDEKRQMNLTKAKIVW